MNNRTIEDLFEAYLATKRQEHAKNTLKRPLPTPPLPVKQLEATKKQPVEKKRRKLSPNVYVSHYFQRGCKSNRSDTFECDAMNSHFKQSKLALPIFFFFPFCEHLFAIQFSTFEIIVYTQTVHSMKKTIRQ